MAADEIVVSLGVKIDQLINGFEKAAADVGESLAKIETSISATSSALEDKLAPAAQHAEEELTHLHESTEGIGGALAGLREQFGALLEFSGIAAGVEIFAKLGEEIEKVGARAVQLHTLSEVIGVDTDRLQALQLAAEEAGVGEETLTRATIRLAETLAQARTGASSATDKLLALGVASSQIHDPTFTMGALLEQLHDRLTDSATATETQAALMQTFGSRAALVVEALKAYAGSEEAVAEKMKAVAGLTEEEIARLKEAKTWWGELGTEIENITAKTFVAATEKIHDLIGAQQQLAEAEAAGMLADAGDDGAGDEQLKQLAAAGELVQENYRAQQKAAVENAALVDQMGKAQLKQLEIAVAAAQDGSRQKIALLEEERDISVQLYTESSDKVLQLDKEIAAAQRALTDANIAEFERETRAQEENAKLRTDIIKSQLKESDQFLDQSVKTAEQAAKATLDATVAGIRQQETAQADLAKQHQISWQQELAGERELIGQELAARVQYYQQLKALAAAQGKDTGGPQTGEVKAATDAATQLARVTQQSADQVHQQWQRTADGIATAFSSNLNRVIQGTQTMAGAMRSIFQEMVSNIVSTLAKVAAQMVVNAAIAKATNTETAKSSILGNAAEAASAAMASAAKVPYIGWILAPAAGAAVYAAALAFPSAEGGFDIPSGLNPMTQLHEQEMVLPADLAGGFRNIIANQQQGQQQGGGPRGVINLTSTVNHDGQHLVDHDQFVKLARQAGFRFSYNTR
jgi:hypothetical protein